MHKNNFKTSKYNRLILYKSRTITTLKMMMDFWICIKFFFRFSLSQSTERNVYIFPLTWLIISDPKKQLIDVLARKQFNLVVNIYLHVSNQQLISETEICNHVKNTLYLCMLGTLVNSIDKLFYDCIFNYVRYFLIVSIHYMYTRHKKMALNYMFTVIFTLD